MNRRINRNGLIVGYDYNIYANDIILDGIAGINDEVLRRKSGASHDSVFELLRHMLGGEDYLFALCQPQRMPDPIEIKTVADFRPYYQRVAARNKAFLDGLLDSELDQDVTMHLRGKPHQFAMWQILMQSLLHSVHHRGELSILLTQLGHPLPDMDIIIQFMR